MTYLCERRLGNKSSRSLWSLACSVDELTRLIHTRRVDTFAAVEEGLRQELMRDRRLWMLLEHLAEDEALELGREAGRAVLGPVMLREMLGDDRFDTSAAARLLQVTRQALHKRARAGKLLAVPGRGTTWYPAWQFDVGSRDLRPSARAALAAWVEVLGPGFEPETVLAWANSPQPELADQTPADWIQDGGEDGPLVDSARRAARRLAA